MPLAEKCHVVQLPVWVMVIGVVIQSLLMVTLFFGPEVLFNKCAMCWKRRKIRQKDYKSAKKSASQQEPDNNTQNELEDIELSDLRPSACAILPGVDDSDTEIEEDVGVKVETEAETETVEMEIRDSGQVVADGAHGNLTAGNGIDGVDLVRSDSSFAVAQMLVEMFSKPKETTYTFYFLKQAIAVLLMVCTTLQAAVDVLIFVMTFSEDTLGEPWLHYQCYALVVTNSPNLKAVLLIFLIRRLYDVSELHEKIYGFQVINSLFVKIYSAVWLPVVFTHVIPMFFTYIWVHIIGTIAALILWVSIVLCLKSCIRKDSPIILFVGFVIVGVFFIPICVVTNSAQAYWYGGDGYMESLGRALNEHSYNVRINNAQLPPFVSIFMLVWSFL